MLKNDALVFHGHISKLMNSKIAYVGDKTAPARLESLRNQAKTVLSSPDERLTRCEILLRKMKTAYAILSMSESIKDARLFAADMIDACLSTIVLASGEYFHRGIRNVFEEIEPLPKPDRLIKIIGKIVGSSEISPVKEAALELLRSTSSFVDHLKPEIAPDPSNLKGAAEEMYSNRKNKLALAAGSDDAFSSFMDLAAFQSRLNEITAGHQVSIPLALERYYGVDLSDYFREQYQRMPVRLADS